jgi:urease accessory protein
MHLSKPHWDGNSLIINAVNPTAGLFAGDQVDVTVRICAGARAVLTSPSATRVFRAQDPKERTQVTQSLLVESGGRLDVFPEILIAHAGARYAQATRIEVQAGGELFLTEMIAPGRTASGEFFDYDQLEFGMELIVADKLAIRERFRMESCSEGLQALRSFFPSAYYASFLMVCDRPVSDNVQRAVGELNTPHVLAGASCPAKSVYAIKLVAADSLSFRVAVSALRTIGYSYLGWPEPILRKL